MKGKYDAEWTGSQNCTKEFKELNSCMTAEKRRYSWMDKEVRPPIYEYVQNRIKERAMEANYELLSQ